MIHRTGRLLLLWIILGALCACTSLPPLADRPASTALPPATDSPLARELEPQVKAHRGKTGIVSLPDPHDAFVTRVLLAREARQSIDVQYYIWRKDVTGILLLTELGKAADRGVRVRLLLDDMNTGGLDDEIALIDAHPNVEVRLFNPFKTRGMRWIGYLTDFDRLNRRMHNKSFTVDNLATVIGGRNVGDEYFGAGESVLFSDLDVVAVGQVVPEVSEQFDQYWASASSYSVRAFLKVPPPEREHEIRDETRAIENSREAHEYFDEVRSSPMAQALKNHSLGSSLEWTTTHMISDDPAKGLGMERPGSLVLDRLRLAVGDPQRKLDLISAYFVPGESGTETLLGFEKNGVHIRILTNSLEATDVPPVHAGYVKRREALLEGGITLYELKRSAAPEGSVPPKKKPGGSGGSGGMGSSSSSLHAKTFAVDDARVYVGSFNFDPRSDKLNTEMGFLIDSPRMASRISDFFDTQVPPNSYQPRLKPDGKLEWLEVKENQSVVHYDSEPNASWWRRVQVFLIKPLPVDSLL